MTHSLFSRFVLVICFIKATQELEQGSEKVRSFAAMAKYLEWKFRKFGSDEQVKKIRSRLKLAPLQEITINTSIKTITHPAE